MDNKLLQYLKERENTYFKRFLRADNYFSKLSTSNIERRFHTIEVAIECRIRMSDYIKLQIQ